MEEKIMRYNIYLKYKNKYVKPPNTFDNYLITLHKNIYGSKPKKEANKMPIYNYNWINYMDENVHIPTEYFTRLERYKTDRQVQYECALISHKQTQFENKEPIYKSTKFDKQESIVQQYLFNFTMDIK